MLMNDGGPAFPSPNCTADGMSLRDWFAGMAMQGLLAKDFEAIDGNEPVELTERGTLNAYAMFAYKLADTMLAERAERTPCVTTKNDAPNTTASSS